MPIDESGPADDGERSFHGSVTRLLELIASERSDGGHPEDLTVIVQGLSRFLAGKFQSLSEAEIADITSESLTRFVQAAQAGRVDPDRAPAAYLTRIAHNLAVSELRRAGRQGRPQEGLADDDLARMLDARASSEQLAAALRQAAQAGDHTLIRVVRIWLSLAESCAREPSSREVAARAGLSHTAVNDALGRLRDYLPE